MHGIKLWLLQSSTYSDHWYLHNSVAVTKRTQVNIKVLITNELNNHLLQFMYFHHWNPTQHWRLHCGKWWIGKDLEGSDLCLIDIVWYFPLYTEENHETRQKVSWPFRDPTWHLPHANQHHCCYTHQPYNTLRRSVYFIYDYQLNNSAFFPQSSFIF